MPILFPRQMKNISKDEYHAVVYKMMGMVYKIHRELGPYWNEKIYQNELIRQCRKNGILEVTAEVTIIASFRDFLKTYYIDLLLNDSIIGELKTVSALNATHKQQLLNYLFLTGMQFGILVNFQSTSATFQYVTTGITSQKRYQLKTETADWDQTQPDSVWLKNIILEVLQEWGAFLDLNLFYEVIYFYRGGETEICRRVAITNEQQVLGYQKINLLNPETGFILTSFAKVPISFKQFINTLLTYTDLTRFHWINFNHNYITFKTIKK